MPRELFEEWLEFDELEPIGRTAQLTALVAAETINAGRLIEATLLSVNGAPQKKLELVQPADYFSKPSQAFDVQTFERQAEQRFGR